MDYEAVSLQAHYHAFIQYTYHAILTSSFTVAVISIAGDSGFINNHVMMGAYLEQSLRLVNPRTSLHYMEYTRYFGGDDWDAHLADALDGGAWSELMTDTWFGRNDPYSGEIVDGRWAHAVMPTADDAFWEREGIDKDGSFFPEEAHDWEKSTSPHIVSPYGLLRAPWNYNTHNYTLRYNNVNAIAYDGVSDRYMYTYQGTTCADYQKFIESDAVGKPMSHYLRKAQVMHL